MPPRTPKSSTTSPKSNKPRTRQQQRGDEAEVRAAQLLTDAGLRILHRNLRQGRDEVDLVVEAVDALGPLVVFVEVRRRPARADALESINAAKQRRIIRAAGAWLAINGPNRRCRFDVVVVGDSGISHLVDAFRPA